MFENLRQTLLDALQRATHPQDRRAVVAEMKATLAQARVGVDDLRTGAGRTRARLTAERGELETVRRRRALAQAIDDRETVAVAERYERQHAERVGVLERKLEAEDRELALAEGELAAMLAEFKSAAAGEAVPRAAAGPAPPAPDRGPAADPDVDPAADPTAGPAADPLHDSLRDSLDAMGRTRARAARDVQADEQLAALKRRMGR